MPRVTNDQPRQSNRLSSVASLIPIAIGVLSLLLAGWQYLERRDSERELATLQVKQQEYELMETKLKNSVHLEEFYLNVNADLLYWILAGKSDHWEVPPAGKIRESELNAALVGMMHSLEETLPWNVDLKLVSTLVVDDIRSDLEKGEQLDELRLLVLRNDGLYSMRDVQVDTAFETSHWNGSRGEWEQTYEPYRIDVGLLPARSAVAFCIEAKRRFKDFEQAAMNHDDCARLVPNNPDEHSTEVLFTDELTGQRSSRQIREEYKDTRLIIDPWVQVGG